MKLLPDNYFREFSYMNKIFTYLLLNRWSCPVFKSVLLQKEDIINEDLVQRIKKYFNNDDCIIRYQYFKPCNNPIMGGNKVSISIDNLVSKKSDGAWMWLLEPIDRLSNMYGINIYFNYSIKKIFIEIVGKGFDVSDLNRGVLTAHQHISMDLPINMGHFGEWWKYAKFDYISSSKYNKSKYMRLEKLNKLGYKDVNCDIFSDNYIPISYDLIEKLIIYINYIYSNNNGLLSDFVVSCSVDSNGKFVFWDIQTYEEKKFILGY